MRTKKPATYQDLVDLPPLMVGEIVDGELYGSPRPANAHQRVCSVLGIVLGDAYDRARAGPGGWWIFDESEVHLGQDVVVPDLAGWRRERMPQVPNQPYFTLAPDWVCEVLSPGTIALDRGRKKHVYAREGVSHLWFIDPIERTLEALRLQDGHWLELDTWIDQQRARIEPFAEIELALGELWI